MCFVQPNSDRNATDKAQHADQRSDDKTPNNSSATLPSTGLSETSERDKAFSNNPQENITGQKKSFATTNKRGMLKGITYPIIIRKLYFDVLKM